MWTDTQPQEEITTMLLPRADRYGRVSWRTDGSSRYFASIHYTDDEQGDWGISPPCSFAYRADALRWVERLIDLPPKEADRTNHIQADEMMAARRAGVL